MQTIKNYFTVIIICFCAVILAAIIKDIAPLSAFGLFAFVD